MEAHVVSLLSSEEMKSANRVQILDETMCLSLRTDTLWKWVNQAAETLTISKESDSQRYSDLVRQQIRRRMILKWTEPYSVKKFTLYQV